MSLLGANPIHEAKWFSSAKRLISVPTSEMTVNYLKPVPLQQPLRVESREVEVKGRKHINMAEILNEKGKVLARSQGLFIAIDVERMFAKFAQK